METTNERYKSRNKNRRRENPQHSKLSRAQRIRHQLEQEAKSTNVENGMETAILENIQRTENDFVSALNYDTPSSIVEGVEPSPLCRKTTDVCDSFSVASLTPSFELRGALNDCSTVSIETPLPATKFIHTPVDLVEYQSSSSYEIAYEKCVLGSKKVNGPVIVEDTSLCFHAMGNLPGPYVKWFLKTLGPEGLYRLLDAWEDKSAHVECFVAFTAGKGKPVVVFSGKMDGIMIFPQGEGGFGFDSCFSPHEGQSSSNRLSFAEYSMDNRYAVSHRCKALRALKDYFLTKEPSDIGFH